MLARRVSMRSAAAMLGVPVATLSRYLGAHAAGGLEALTPDAAPGRKPKFSLSDTEKCALRNLRLRKGSAALAIEWFVRDPACTPATRDLITAELDRAAQLRREPHWPESLRRAAHVSTDEQALFRGKKAAMETEFCERRGLEWIDEDGRRLPLGPNVLWESDDMSSNEPHTWRDPNGAPRIGRQVLCTIDVFSCHWLGASPLGRDRDAYRAEDIAEHMLACVEAHGLPTLWRLERGAWENNFVDGIRVGFDADGTERRWGGLSALTQIVRAWKSRQKGTIESSFDLLQSLLAHESISIGRHRGEFENATKLFLAAAKGDAEAWARFWSISAAADGFAEAMQAFNHRPKKRRAFGRDLVVPADLFRPAQRRELKPEDAWRFCPVKLEATVRQGHIEKSVDHYPLPFRFRVNGVEDGLYLEHGYKVLVAFHPGHPERGCHIFNGETGALNRENWAFGEPLLVAPLAEDAPQVNLAPHEREMHARKNANAAVRGEFRAIVPAGRAGSRTSTQRDGWGNSAVVARGDNSFTQRGSNMPEPSRDEARDEALTSRVAVLPPSRPRANFDEAAELDRLAHLERDAIARGDLMPI